MNSHESSPLGQRSAPIDHYDRTLLFPIARAEARAELRIDSELPFLGADLWTAFELGWLNRRGKPQVAIAHFTVPCETPNLIESKSWKLYLGSFSNSVFDDAEAVRQRLRGDLDEALGRGGARSAGIGVRLIAADAFAREAVRELEGVDLDRLDLDCDRYTPAPDLLSCVADAPPVDETLTSRLFRSTCPVTGQPDWGSVQLRYSGPQIEQAALLRYLVSFRNHSGFHEQCVERIFMDVWRRCRPTRLAVYARYTRRGGLDINPFRTSWPQALPANLRTARQ
ncbi:MAG: NADPH-dependent 7-cyano-7-deazaguanine reductase QueF [Variovorax sp.]